MSARSCCVTCGIVAHAALRCSAVLRRTARIGCRSISPHREKSGSGSARRRRRPAAGGSVTIRLACAFTSSIEMRPPLPLPATWSMSTPSSRAMRRTDGAAGATGSSGAAGSAAGRAPRLMSTTFSGPGRGAHRARLVGRLAASRLRRAARVPASSSGTFAAVIGARPRAACAGGAARRLGSTGAAAGRLRLVGRRSAVVDGEDRLADLHLVAGLDLDFLDPAGHRRRHLDRRLVGLELEDRLIFRR